MPKRNIIKIMYTKINKDNYEFTKKELEFINKNVALSAFLEYKKNNEINEMTILETYNKLKKDNEIGKTPWDPLQKLICSICGKIYLRTNKSKHYKTKFHLLQKALKKNI